MNYIPLKICPFVEQLLLRYRMKFFVFVAVYNTGTVFQSYLVVMESGG